MQCCSLYVFLEQKMELKLKDAEERLKLQGIRDMISGEQVSSASSASSLSAAAATSMKDGDRLEKVC